MEAKVPSDDKYYLILGEYVQNVSQAQVWDYYWPNT